MSSPGKITMSTNEDILTEIRVVRQELGNLKQDVDGLKEQVGINCNKLDTMKTDMDVIKEHTDILPQMYGVVQANGQGIEGLAERLDKLER